VIEGISMSLAPLSARLSRRLESTWRIPPLLPVLALGSPPPTS
jgi:hypothetical protein